jgi:hypothetical protein
MSGCLRIDRVFLLVPSVSDRLGIVQRRANPLKSGLGKALVLFDELAFVCDDDGLELLSLSDHLLTRCLYFFLKMQDFLE